MKKVFIITISFLTIMKVQAQAAGSYDWTFDGDGKAKYCLASGYHFAIANAGLQSSGKIVCYGTTFSTTFTNDKILLIRYNTNGSIDTSFGINGVLDPSVFAVIANNIIRGFDMLIQPDDKIIITGYQNPSIEPCKIARFTANGALDTTFNGTGYLEFTVGSNGNGNSSLGLQSDGKILVGNYGNNGMIGNFSITRLNSNGTIDSSFGNFGSTVIATASSINNMALQPDGKIVVVGIENQSIVISDSDYDIVAFRLLPNGLLDSTFGTNGKVVIPLSCYTEDVQKVLVQVDGKILILGGRDSICSNGGTAALIRLNTNGSFDNTFGTNGYYYIQPLTIYQGNTNNMVLQLDGKILVCGNGVTNEFKVARINSNGTVDTSFANAGLLSNAFYTDSSATSVLIQPDNKIVVCGSTKDVNNSSPSCSAVIRLNAGTLGVEGFELQNISVYPNPATHSFAVNTAVSKVTVYNLTGQLVQEFKGGFESGYNYDIQSLSAGVYLVKIVDKNQSVTKKIIKQ